MNEQSDQYAISYPDYYDWKNCLKFLSFRERGQRCISLRSSDVFTFKTKQIHLTDHLILYEKEMDSPQSYSHLVRSRSEKGYVIIFRNDCDESHSLHLLRLTFRPNTSKHEFPSLISKTEFIESLPVSYCPENAGFYKMRSIGQPLLAYTAYVPRIFKSSIMFSILGENNVDVHYSIEGKALSCAFSPDKERFVVGVDSRELYIYERLEYIHKIGLVITPSSLEFDQTGNITYIGDNKSGLFRQDLRISTLPKYYYTLHRGSIFGIKLLSDGYTAILANNNRLEKIDLRMNRLLYQYPESGALLSVDRPFSVDEDVDILCSTEMVFDTTRLWSLSSGEPLCTIKPNSHSGQQSCILSNENQWGLGLFFDNNMHLFEPY